MVPNHQPVSLYPQYISMIFPLRALAMSMNITRVAVCTSKINGTGLGHVVGNVRNMRKNEDFYWGYTHGLMIKSGWWFQSLWKIWKSVGKDYPTYPIYYGKIKHVWNHQPVMGILGEIHEILWQLQLFGGFFSIFRPNDRSGGSWPFNCYWEGGGSNS